MITSAPVIVSDIALFAHPNGAVVLRSGGDGRHRIAVPAEDRAAVARALLPPGTVAVAADRLARLVEFTAAALVWEATDDPWDPDAREATKPRLFAARAALREGDTEAVAGPAEESR